MCLAVYNFKATLQGKVFPITVSIGPCLVVEVTRADRVMVINCANDAQKRAVQRGLGQVHHINLDQYWKKNRRVSCAAVSIDEALVEIAQGGEKVVVYQME